MRPVKRRCAVAAALAGGALASMPVIAEAAPPCASGTFEQPSIRATDRLDGARLTATHSIDLEARFTGEDPGGVSLSGPGVRGHTLVAVQPGPVIVRASWEQTVGATGEQCEASTTATLTIAPAVSPRLVPRRGGSFSVALDLRFARVGANVDPLELRLRAVRGPRLPGPRVPFVKRTLRLDPNSAASPTFATPIHVTLHADPSQLFDSRGRLLRNAYVALTVGGGHIGKRFQRRGYGFEVQVLQGGRRIGRARGTADHCDPRFDCRQRSLKVTP